MNSLKILVLVTWFEYVSSGIGSDSIDNEENSINIGKCCDVNESLVNYICEVRNSSSKPWSPEFLDDNSSNGFKPLEKLSKKYKIQTGSPKCRENEQSWMVYNSTSDILTLLPTGKLRHYVRKPGKSKREIWSGKYEEDLYDDDGIEARYYDYMFGQYCIDMATLIKDEIVIASAMICVPPIPKSNGDYIMRRIADPIIRALGIATYLLVAITYFVLPQLRDLVGNMITSMCLCMVVHQIAITITIFKEFANHIHFLMLDTVAYTFLLAAFFWLNALGYFVWITFRSRNVFLTVTDGRKYCYYSTYVWGMTITIAAMAIFAHFALEISGTPVEGTGFEVEAQTTIGWLALSILFLSIAFTIIIDLSFVISTVKTIKRMRTYGRIHHKMKYSLRMFTLIYLILSFGWLSMMLSLTMYDHLVYFNIIVNLFQASAILWVCIFGQKRVTFLVSKTCNCCDMETPTPEGLDWGEEMTAINAGY